MRILAMLAALMLTACAQSGPPADGAENVPRITGSGVVDYGTYQTVRAQNGDTVASLARRHGLSASAIGSYNGLAPDAGLQAGDELVVPPPG